MSDKKRILVVDDDKISRIMLRKQLETNGYEVDEAEDGTVGLEKARNTTPDLIILDVMMPKIDGYKVARLLKFDQKHMNIPIVLLTARFQQADRETGMEVGGDAYLAKPFAPEEMLTIVGRLLSERKPPLPGQSAPTQPGNATAK
ncbi:MAG: response regulator [Kiritimatiellaeota bacterium]|nr:response regulator [Kiritimatiellota bacterium]